MPNDEFEALLERCHNRLAEISLTVHVLESDAPRQAPFAYTLAPAAPPPPPSAAAAPPAPAPEAAPPAPAAAAAAPQPDLAPKPPPRSVDVREEDEIFPPMRIRPSAPPPPVPPRRAYPTPVPAPASGGGGRAAAAAAGVAATGAFGFWLAHRPAADLLINVIGADALAVRPEKGDLLVAEGKSLIDLARDGRTLSTLPLDAPIDSMRWEQGSLWTSDGRTPTVVERVEGGRATVFTLNHVPASICVKDKYLWTVEQGGHTLHQFLISRSILGAILQPIDSFELGGRSPDSFTIDDDGTLWVVEDTTRRLFKLRLENGAYKLLSSAPLSPFVGPEGKLEGLTIEGDAVWIMAQPTHGKSGALRRIRLSNLDWTPA